MLMMTFGGFGWVAIAGLFSALSLLTVAKQQAPEDPIQDLTFSVRHPYRWGAAHPLRASARLFRKIRP